MTSINTQRLHLNTDDGIKNDNGNHANTTFNLAKANIGCLSNQLLSVSLVKAVLPITLDAIGYNLDDQIAFTMKIVDSNFVDQVLNCYITRNTLDIPPYSATRPTEFKFPITYLDSPITLQDTLNEILASQYSGSSGLRLIITPSSARTVVQFDSGTVTELVFDNSYVVAGRANYNKPGQRLFTALGINTFDNLEMGQLISAETIFKGGNGGIDAGTNVDLAFQLSLFHPPLNLVSNLGLDSASSNSGGSRNNILAGIQIEVEDQSRGIECTHIGGDVLFESPPPDPEPVNIFNGVPIDTQAFSIFDATYYIFYKDYKYYIYNYATNTTSAGVAFGNGTSVMSQIPTGQTINMGYVDAPNSWTYINVGSNWYKFSYVFSSGVPSFTYIQTISNASWFGGGMPTSGWDGLAPYSNGIDMFLFNGSSYVKTAYGGQGQPFDGLPTDIGCIDIRIDDTLKGWGFKGDKYYEISLTYSGIGGGTALIGRRPNGGTLVSSGTLPSASNNIFNGVPHNHQASGVFPSDPTITYFFYYDGTINKVYKHDSTSNTTTIHDIGSGANELFPNLPTNQAMYRAVWSTNGHVYVKWENSPGVYHQRPYSDPTTNPQSATSTPDDTLHDAKTANTSYAIGISPTQLLVRLPNNGWATDHQYNQGSWGGTTTHYNGLPQTGHRSMNMIIGFNAMVNVFYDTGIVYTIDLSSQTVVASAPYGATIPTVSATATPVASSTTGTTIIASKSSSLINHINYSVGASHKIVSSNSVSTLNLILESSDGDPKFCDGNIYYEIEFKTYDTLA